MKTHAQEYLESTLEDASVGEFEGLRVTDLCQIPARYTGEVLYWNDHGNITLYRAYKNGNLREIASRV
jgi:hypothetical protein